MEIKRTIFPLLKGESENDRITILTGARQVGKTFLLKKLESLARKNKKRTAFFDLEQPEIMASFNRSETEIIQMLTNNHDIIFLDECYYLKNISHIFKAIYDKKYRVKIFASGSSSLQIHKHLKESLAGRKKIIHIFPCHLKEMSQLWQDKSFNSILKFGGLPGITHCNGSNDIIDLLADIHQSYIMKDVKSLIKEENIRAFNHLIYLMAERQGSIISVSVLSREIGLTSRSLEKYIQILNQTSILFPVPSFSRNLGNELKKSRKYYLYDIGIRNMIVKDFRPVHTREDGGFLLESFVFLELLQLQDPVSEIRFWRTKDGKEVDFIFIKNRIPYPIEVKSSVKIGWIPPGLKSFLSRYSATPRAYIINQKTEGETSFGKTRIFYKLFQNIPHFLEWIDTE